MTELTAKDNKYFFSPHFIFKWKVNAILLTLSMRNKKNRIKSLTLIGFGKSDVCSLLSNTYSLYFLYRWQPPMALIVLLIKSKYMLIDMNWLAAIIQDHTMWEAYFVICWHLRFSSLDSLHLINVVDLNLFKRHSETQKKMRFY